MSTDQPDREAESDCPGGHECPNYTGADMNAEFARGVAEGRRQATEGWEREWAVAFTDKTWPPNDSEQSARTFAALYADGHVVSRLVGPWEPAPTEPADSLAPGLLAPTELGGEPVEQPEPEVVLTSEPVSAETVASIMAVVDAPYRQGLDVDYDVEQPEDGAR